MTLSEGEYSCIPHPVDIQVQIYSKSLCEIQKDRKWRVSSCLDNTIPEFTMWTPLSLSLSSLISPFPPPLARVF